MPVIQKLISLPRRIISLRPDFRHISEWQPDERHLARVGNPRFFHHPYQSAQQELWEPGSVEWFVIIRTSPLVRRRKRKSRLVVVQLPLLPDGTQG